MRVKQDGDEWVAVEGLEIGRGATREDAVAALKAKSPPPPPPSPSTAKAKREYKQRSKCYRLSEAQHERALFIANGAGLTVEEAMGQMLAGKLFVPRVAPTAPPFSRDFATAFGDAVELPLADLRLALPQYTRAAFDQGLKLLRREGKFQLSAPVPLDRQPNMPHIIEFGVQYTAVRRVQNA